MQHEEEPPRISETKSNLHGDSDLVRSIEIFTNKLAGIRFAALTGLFLMSILYTLYFAREILIPIVIALLLNFLFRPVLRSLKRLHIPPPVGAGILLFIILGAISIGILYLSGPAYDWVAKVRADLPQIEYRARELLRPVFRVQEAAEQVQKLAEGTEQGSVPEVEVQVTRRTLTDIVLEKTSGFVALIALMFLLLYFMLAYEDVLLRKLIQIFPKFKDKKRVLELVVEVEESVSAYLVMATILNSAMGIAVGIVMYFIGLPNPILWGTMAALLEFVPYLGPLVGMVIITVIGLITFDTPGYALLAPLFYLVLETIQGNFLVPLVFSRRFSLNPVVVLVWLIFWSWLWGIPGALLAAPMLTIFKIFCDRLEPLETVGNFIGS